MIAIVAASFLKVFHGISSSVYNDRLSGFPAPYSSRFNGIEIDLPFEADPVTEHAYNVSSKCFMATFHGFLYNFFFNHTYFLNSGGALIIFVWLTAYEEYIRCPPEIHSYDYYCFVILAEEVFDYDASRLCAELGGWPVWFTDAAEWNWFQSFMNDYDISYCHIGKDACPYGSSFL